VRLTRDHRLAVVHDPDLQRLCGVPTSVARSTLDTVRKHPVTLGPNPSEHLPRIPELAEVLELPSPAAGPWLTLIEIKTPQPPEHPAPPVEPYHDAHDEALTPLAGEPPPFRLMGFSETLLLAIKSARPHWPVLWLPRDTLTTTRILERWRHTALHTLDGIGHSHALGPAPQLRDCLPPGGKTLSVWTVNHPADARAYAHCGYDLLTTDFPRRLIEDGPHSGNPR
jgi:glycerophosphoryl diester phosphodiesterase